MRISAIFVVVFLVTGLFLLSASIVRADETSEIILQVLIKKGLITQKEIDDMKGEIKKAQAQNPAAAEKPAESTAKKDDTLKVYWKDGINIRTEDKTFDLKVGGRILTDIMMFQQDSPMNAKFGEESTNGEIRSARIHFIGSIYRDYFYKFEMDFAGASSPVIKDMYAGMKNIPYLGTFRAGNYKQPVSLEELAGDINLTFMERSLSNLFMPSYKLGLQFNNTAFDQRLTWTASLFNEAVNSNEITTASATNGLATSNEWSLAARVTGLPWYEDNGAKLLHLGIGYALRNPEQRIQFRQRPEAHMAPYFTDTGSFAATNISLVDYEFAGVYGPLFLQGEFIQDFVNKTNSAGTSYFQGCYAQVSYFLTGEHREYDKVAGIFGRVRPYKNFSFSDHTYGAWEIAGRYSYVDLKDSGINGGLLNDATIGLNWYLNPNMRIMENYIHSHRNDVGDADLLMTRFQVDY